jgi:3-deoxy-D-arabino-heptulosonate 7-phosphate (DAHP) synthase
MAMYAPEIPPLTDLEQAYPLDLDAEREIQVARADVSDVLSGERDGLVVIEGPCAMTLAREVIDREGDALYEAQDRESGLITLHRMPPWKPRTNPADWHGLESEPDTVEAAYRTIAERAEATANVAIEVGHIPHLDRYGRRITLGWIGSRNAGDGELVDALATYDPSMPVGVKNAMDGTIDSAVAHVARIDDLREGRGAPAVVMYRGGTNAQTPEAWEANYRRALERTAGRLIVDTAHGGEMAFDPDGNYKKSILGQIACLERVIQIAEDHGEMPAGIIMEASGAESPTDPVMPFRIALNGARRLHELRMSVASAAA